VFARLSYFKGTRPQIDAALELIRDRLDPSLRTQAGFVGSVTMVDHTFGEGLTASVWQSGIEMGAAEDVGTAGRDAISERVGVQLTDVDRFELILQDSVAPLTQGTFVRYTELRGTPDLIDATRALAIQNTIPALKDQQGYRGLVMGANRASGRIFVMTEWASAADLEASDAVGGERRDAAAKAALASSVRVARYETALANLEAT
jgi:hypothetical protein